MIRLCFICFFLFTIPSLRSQSLIHVPLSDWAKDEKFDKAINPLAFYYTSGDTIWSDDVESLLESKPIVIRRPTGFNSYAYGYVHFSGVCNDHNPGMTCLLLVNVKDRNPLIYTDHNNNYDFTDDGDPVKMPAPYMFKDSALLTLRRTGHTQDGLAIRLSRINFINKYAYKDLLNEYYQIYAPNRQFVGIDWCFREQRYQVRSGLFMTRNDTFRIALADMNNNGRFNDKDTDRIISGNRFDSIFDTHDELHSFLITSDKKNQYIERNGEQYELLQIDPEGRYMVFNRADSTQLFDKIPQGKKVPKFRFTDWEGKRYKIGKFRRKQVFIYFTNPQLPGFANDTVMLRQLAELYKHKLVVVGFIDVNRSYELRIFGTYANLNWIAAFRDKYVLHDLRLRGVPSSLWLGKRRKVKQYGITPEELLRQLEMEK